MSKVDGEAVAGCCLIGALAMLFPLCFGGCYGCSKVQVSDGYRDSTVRKVSHTGVFWKTWEVEALGDGMRAATDKNGAVTMSPETFQYTVSDPAVLDKLRDLPPTKRVRVHYRKMLAAWEPNGESRYFITNVEDLP